MVVPMVKLSSGYEMPLLGLGTRRSNPGEMGKAVEVAVNTGYTHIDCAWLYNNQKHVVEILDQLQLTYIDLMLIHWPVAYEEGGDPFPKRPGSDKLKHSSEDYVTTWTVLEDFVKERKIRNIGISNFNHKQIERLIANSTIKPAVLQVELHPYLQQKNLREFCKQNGIAVTAYSSLGNPGSAYFRKPGDPNILTDPVVTRIAAAHGKTPAQVSLRWAVQQNIIVIPKSTSEERIKENSAVFDFQLTEAEMKEIDGLDRGWRIVDLSARDSQNPHFPFFEEY
ncbi:unnamed protein product [Angiostrongylus costaricensis]|uniref:Aldo_ket_red domain-containing protein n=1 Tax=Angiostrongylus costaricensis TaxID=334426 RepID=A0A0R3Q0E0_ANGCS|nr:unnamed protein product [Angiostrongylus costaricensis]